MLHTSSASFLCGDDAAIMTLGSPTAHVPVRCASAILRRSQRAAAWSQMPCAHETRIMSGGLEPPGLGFSRQGRRHAEDARHREAHLPLPDFRLREDWPNLRLQGM